MNCRNCGGDDLTSRYCPDCGQPKELKRIDAHYIVHEIEHVLHFERGIFYTIRELFTRPGLNVKNYISENRSRLVKPIIFIILTSLIYTLINHAFHFDDKYMAYEGQKNKSALVMFQWIQDHYGYANIMLGIFVAVWIKIFFKKYPYNFFEVLILLCFIMGISMLIFSVFAIAQHFTAVNLMEIASIISVLYCAWGIGQFFDKDKLVNYFYGFAAYFLGLLTFSMGTLILGILIDLVIQ
ncbi:DUF3667 domain-containing protein [Sphingobacterium sp. Mn56C]|uniref:DUF3667 domain-containing protein n=1 Tax=Sphingobacterium sp. Mn56C TaxID=3395261 RepID=UPI003BE48E72